MLNLQDNLRPREIERQVREYQKVHRLLPYFTSWCMDALATSKNGYIVYSTAEHPAGAHGPVSTVLPPSTVATPPLSRSNQTA